MKYHLRTAGPPSSASSGRWIVGLVTVAVLAGVALYGKLRLDAAPSPSVFSGIRTAAVATGTVEESLRLTGVTAAEDYASLLSPRLRGSRSDMLRSGGSIDTTATSASAALQPLAGSNSSVATASSNLSSALQAATSRIAPTSSSSSASSSTSDSTTTSTAMGSSGLGSTSGALPSLNSGGGNGSDFDLILQQLVSGGTHVAKGQVVAEFDRQYMLLRLDDYRATLVQAEAALTKLKTDMQLQRKAYDQDLAQAKAARDKAALDLKTAPVLSAIEAAEAKLAYEQAEAAYKEKLSERKLFYASLDAQYRDNDLELRQMKIEFARAQANADRMIMRAPIGGLTVLQLIWRSGQLAQVKKGDQLWPGMHFLSIADTHSMVVNATVNQVDVERLRLGLKARVRFDAYPGLELPAHVYSIGGMPGGGGQRATYVETIPVRLRLDAVDPRVLPDLTVSADVIVATAPQAVIAPLGAVFRDTGGEPYVFVRRAGGWERRGVELGLANNLNVAVRSGLKPGDVVALDRPAAGIGGGSPD
jgi:HlyD family secretion protein